MIVVNGRFLRSRPTGMHRAGRALVDGARSSGLAMEVVAPPGVVDERVDRVVWAPSGRAGDHVWEQVVLPVAAGGRLVLSLANTAPLAARRSAIWIHDLGPVVGPHWFRPHVRLYAGLMVASMRRAELVLVPSAQVAEEVRARRRGTGRVAVVRTAVDQRFRARPAPEVERVRSRFRLDGPFVVHVGWHDPRKDAMTAAAAHLLAAKRQAHDLVLVGRPHPTFQPVALPSAPTIRELGFVDDDDLACLLTGAAALVFPSVYEGFGLPPAEAMACGTPALVSDLPALRESTSGGARYLPVGNVDRWAEAILDALDGAVPVTPAPPWSSADMTAQFLDALEGPDRPGGLPLESPDRRGP